MIPIVHRFYASGNPNGIGKPVDPVAVEAALTPSDNMTPVLVHSRAMPGALVRHSIGVWVLYVDETRLEPGKRYTAHFKYTLPNQRERVDRHPFSLASPLPAPKPGNCILHGRLTSLDGLPEGGLPVRAETFASPLSITHRLTAESLLTESDGTFWFEVPFGMLARFSHDRDVRFILAPHEPYLDIDTVADYTLRAGDTDAFGMPIGPDTNFGFNSPIPVGPSPGFVTVERTGGDCSNDGLWSYTHTQGSPALVWSINHPLAYVPSVRAVGPTGNTMLGDVTFPGPGRVDITFLLAVSGVAYLS